MKFSITQFCIFIRFAYIVITFFPIPIHSPFPSLWPWPLVECGWLSSSAPFSRPRSSPTLLQLQLQPMQQTPTPRQGVIDTIFFLPTVFSRMHLIHTVHGYSIIYHAILVYITVSSQVRSPMAHPQQHRRAQKQLTRRLEQEVIDYRICSYSIDNCSQQTITDA